MKTETLNVGNIHQGIGAVAGRAIGGFAMSEALLVVALVGIVSSVSLRSIATQRKATMELEAKAESNEKQEAMTWAATVLPDGSKVWIRKF